MTTGTARVRLLAFAALVGLTAAGCSRPPDSAAPGPAADGAGPTVIVASTHEQLLRREIQALGSSRARDAVDITSRITNVVTAIHVREGEEVAAGQVLFEMDRSEAEANLALAEAAVKESRSKYGRSEELGASGTVSAFELDELAAQLEAVEAAARAAKARLEETTIRAPFAGRMGLRQVSRGSLITPGEVMSTLDDLSSILADFTIPEGDLSAIRIGMEVEVRAAAWPEAIFQGAVTAIDTRIDTATRTVAVRAELPNESRRLWPGMFLEVTLLGQPRPALVIPEQAIVPLGERHYVYRVEGGRAWRNIVEIGARRPGSVEILAGLTEGDLVIVEGTQKVTDASKVRPVHTTDIAGPGQ